MQLTVGTAVEDYCMYSSRNSPNPLLCAGAACCNPLSPPVRIAVDKAVDVLQHITCCIILCKDHRLYLLLIYWHIPLLQAAGAEIVSQQLLALPMALRTRPLSSSTAAP
jgi:hypothetical protein